MIFLKKVLVVAILILLESFDLVSCRSGNQDQCSPRIQGHFSCQGVGAEKKCLPTRHLCDGKTDCEDEKDEADMNCKVPCQEGWKPFRGKCYWNPGIFVRRKQVADLKCASIEGGAKLALPTDQVFDSFLTTLIPKKKPRWLWIDARRVDIEDGESIWVDRNNMTLTYHRWNREELPDSTGWTKHYKCAIFAASESKWAFSFCLRRFKISFVCEGNEYSRRPMIRGKPALEYASGALRPESSQVIWILAALCVISDLGRLAMVFVPGPSGTVSDGVNAQKE